MFDGSSSQEWLTKCHLTPGQILSLTSSLGFVSIFNRLILLLVSGLIAVRGAEKKVLNFSYLAKFGQISDFLKFFLGQAEKFVFNIFFYFSVDEYSIEQFYYCSVS